MNNVCLIPARGGSKRIKNKNVKLFRGIPLISWSIRTAKQSNLFSNVYVSTDSMEIKKIAEDEGAIVPFKRPRHLSDDFATDVMVREHFIDWLEKSNINARFLCYLYPTAPLLTATILKRFYKNFRRSNADSSLVVCKFSYPVQRCLKMDANSFVHWKYPENKNQRSQDLEECYHDAGQCYLFDLSRKTNESRLGFEIPRILCQDIDTIEDFNNLEIMYDLLLKKGFIQV